MPDQHELDAPRAAEHPADQGQLELERTRLVLDREELEQRKINADIECNKRDIAIKEREVEIKYRELQLKRKELDRSTWRDPLFLAILAAAIAAAGSAAVALINGHAQRTLEQTRATEQRQLDDQKAKNELNIEREKAEAARILEIIKVVNPKQAADNLKFLLDTKLVANSETVAGITNYLKGNLNVAVPPATSEVSPSRSTVGCKDIRAFLVVDGQHSVTKTESYAECAFVIDDAKAVTVACPHVATKVTVPSTMDVKVTDDGEKCILFAG